MGRGLRRYQRAILLPLRLMGHSQEDKIEYNKDCERCSQYSFRIVGHRDEVSILSGSPTFSMQRIAPRQDATLRYSDAKDCIRPRSASQVKNEIKICSRASRGRRQARCTSKIILHQKNPLHSCLPRHLRSDSEVKKRIASRAPPAPYELWTPNTRSICRAIIFYKLHLI